MAAGTGQRDAHERAGNHVHLFVVDVVEHLGPVLLSQRLRSQRQESGGDDAAPVQLTRTPGRQQVAGNLLADELVVRQILVERFNDVIAIAPCIRVAVVFVVAGGIGIARDVQPVASPLLAISRRGEQAIHGLLVRFRGMVRQEALDLFLGRRQTG